MALGGLSRGRRRRHLNAEVNIINLVDVVLVLLIIFMVTAPMMQSGVEVRLPKAVARPVTVTDKDLTVALLRGGQIKVGQQQMTPGSFAEQLPLLIKTGQIKKIFIQGDGAATLDQLAPVLAAVQKSGVQMAFVFDPSGRR